MCEVGNDSAMSPRGRGCTGVTASWPAVPETSTKTRIERFEVRMKIEESASFIRTSNFEIRRLIIRCSSSNPVPDQLSLRRTQERSALRHTIPADSYACDLAIEIGHVGHARLHAPERGHLHARPPDRLPVRLRGRQYEVFLGS